MTEEEGEVNMAAKEKKRRRVDTWTTSEGLELPVYLDADGRVSVSTVQARRARGIDEEDLTEGKAPFVHFSRKDSDRLKERLGY